MKDKTSFFRFKLSSRLSELLTVITLLSSLLYFLFSPDEYSSSSIIVITINLLFLVWYVYHSDLHIKGVAVTGSSIRLIKYFGNSTEIVFADIVRVGVAENSGEYTTYKLLTVSSKRGVVKLDVNELEGGTDFVEILKGLSKNYKFMFHG